ncbi:hypothetical protein [Clostridium magnum]|uniref:STAS/SEC14 domain-containing protein n=1 Tax=Clostridium magnum DSM 2767 TaxID=1121326 RepID=A0A162RGL8_9CLOT|nr:hypothetical protein [Clostridium magnum]KZL89873.1 hypothetical protein CLMAG_48870 [Clostridium magnum DSM 2767]SHI47282.1 hypothetical protein SAMN02745944_04372 [Clostridium magnum DSM 2767]
MAIAEKKFEKCSYKLETKPSKKIVYETIEGFWSDKEYSDYVNSYKTIMKQDIARMGNWIKVIDMTNYKTSTVVDLITEHLKWCKEVGLQYLVFIADQTIVKMQMKRSTKEKNGEIVASEYFSTQSEAEEFIKSIGY